jgi:hypothetical protein
MSFPQDLVSTTTAPHSVTVEVESGHVLVPVTPNVANEFGKCGRTIKRWIADPKLDFPRPARINGRLYVSRKALEEWKRSRILASVDGQAA